MKPTTAHEWWLQERENQLDFARLHYDHFGNKSATMWMALFAWAIIATAVAFARGDKLRSVNEMIGLMLEKEDLYKQIRAAHFKRKES